MPDKFAVGVDLGGTKILASVVNLNNGKLLSSSKKKTRIVNDGQELVKRIGAVVEDALTDAAMDISKICGIGIGAAGMVDRDKGILLAAANIGTNDLPISDPLKAQFGVPVKLGNDVEVATIGELNFGAGQECSNFVCIFVGTGIGSGIVHEGKLMRGGSGTVVINFYNPKRIILGGGLIEAVPRFLQVAEEEARRRCLKIPSRKTEIVQAQLGDYAGTIGAALLAR
ncbi:MAG: ROK family protein [Candidatus Obscuribacter sp.]|nr:ROK family protein [Candidatus Obscuribacter sp.]